MSVSAPTVQRHDLERIVGPHHVNVPEFCGEGGGVPAVVVCPETPEQVADILRLAAQNEAPVVTTGGMTHSDQLVQSSIRLDLRRLKQVEHYDPGDLTIGIGAGTTLAEIDALIAPHRQILPIEVADPARATIGGALAVAAEGPLRHGYGAIRDFCIGIHFVTGDGKRAKGGGRVVKNVAGYDLMKLLIGSHGTLGVITAASFKLFPSPQQTRTLVCDFSALQDAMTLRDRIIASALTPVCLELVSPRAHEFLQPHAEARDPDHLAPEEIRGGPGPHWSLVLRAAGSDAILARYRAELGGSTTNELEGAGERDLWHWVVAYADSMEARHRNVMVLRVAVPAAEVASMLVSAERAALDYNFVSAALGRAAAGTFTVGFIPLSVDPPPANYYASAVSEFRALLPRGCVCSVLRCPREAREHFSTWGEPTGDLALMHEVKRALDPANILNPGRYLV